MQKLPAEDKTLRNQIVLFAWPIILTNLLHTLTITVDMIMIGRLGSVAVASVGLGGELVFFSFTVMIAISVGTIALVARYIGAKDNKTANFVLSQSLILGGILSIPITLIGLFFSDDILTLLGAEEDVVITGSQYSQILFLASIFSFTNFLSASALRGAGDTKTPLYVNVVVSIANIGLNYILIFGKFGFPALGVRGAGIATGCSYMIGTILYLTIFLKGKGVLTLSSTGKIIDLKTITKISKTGIPASCEQIIIHLGSIIYVTIIIVFGTNALAAHQIGMRIQSLSFMPGLGFGMAASALVGQYLGAKNYKRAEQSGWKSMQLCVLITGIIGIVLFIVAKPIAYVFVDDVETVNLTVIMIRIFAIGIPAIAIYFTISGGLKGAGDTQSPLYITGIGIYACRLPLALFLGFYTMVGVWGVWLAMTVDFYIRTLLILCRFKSGKWKHIKV